MGIGRRRKQFIESLEKRFHLSAALMADAFDYPLGNFNSAGLSLNGGASTSTASFANQLQLGDGGSNESRSAFTTQQYGVSAFTTNFDVQFGGASTSGFAFVVQGSSSTAVGGGNAGSDGIANSAAIEFLATASGTQVELNINGVTTGPTAISPSNIDLSNARMLQISMEYDGSTLTVSETDGTTTLTPATATQTFTNVNIPGATGSSAYLGFTGAEGSSGTTQVIQSWEFADVRPTDMDIGSPGTAGSSVYSIGGNYAVTGAGIGVGLTSDQLHFVSETITGDATVLGEVTVPTSGSAQDGLMIRGDTTAGGAFAEIYVTSAGAQFDWRTSAGAVDNISPVVQASGVQWLKLVRDGPTISGYLASSANGAWTLVGTGAAIGNGNALAGLAVASGDPNATTIANFSDVSVTATTPIGLETGNVIPQAETQPIWVNIINQIQGFYQVSNQSAPVSVDANGWPTTDFSIPFLLFPIPDDAGVYNVSMQVNQNPTVSVHGASLHNQSYNATTGIYTATITMPGSGTVSMVVTNTNGGARNIQILRPGYSTTNPPVFTTQYINYLESFHPTAIRFMSWAATNSNPVQTWAQRSTPGDATQTGTITLYNYNGTVNETGAQVGVCWEYAIMLCNILHCDMWINVPAQANDAYVQSLASLIQNGDTVNGVYYSGLSPDLNVYVEYSNEVWNPTFEQYQYALNAAVTEVTTDAANGIQSNLNYDNLSLSQNSNGYVWQYVWQERWIARRLMQISNDFASVLGQAAINTRIRPVLANLVNSNNQASQLSYINAVFGAPSQYFYSVATAPYAGMSGPDYSTNTLNGGNANPNLTATQVLQNVSIVATSMTSIYNTLDAVAKQYGLQMEGYESGPDFSGFQDSATSKVQAELDARMTTVLQQYYQAWFESGGGTIIYEYGGARNWGQPSGDFQITDSQDDLFDPKEIAFRDVEGEERPSLAPAPLTSLSATDVSSTQVNLNWGSASAGATAYVVNASTSSSFSTNVVTEVAPAGSSGWSFTGLSPGIKYYFQVIAESSAGNATASPNANATTSGKVLLPTAPTAVSAVDVSSSTITVNWTDPTLIESGFTITIATDPGFKQVVQTLSAAAGATSIAVDNLNPLTTYYAEVSAFNAAGSSAATVSPSPVPTPLPLPVAQYEFNESSGSTVTDSGTGTAANGTINGGVTRVAGPSGGGALLFDGSTGYVTLGTPAKLNIAGEITVSAWIMPTAVTSQGDIIAQNYDGLDTPFFLDLTSPTTVNFGTNRFTGSALPNFQATGTSSVPLTNGQWHYIAGVYDGQNFKVYIDGVLAGQSADPYGVTVGTLSTNIGRGISTSGGAYNYFNGAIADVDIFNTGLTSAQIAALSIQSGPFLDSWVGQTSSNWGLASNWSAAATPGTATTVVISNGTVTTNSAISISNLVLSGGTLQLASGTGGSTVGSLSISPGSVLNINNNHLFINYAGESDPIATIAGYLKSGYNGGGWNGAGINSSTATANSATYGVGYADSADPGNPANLATGTIEVKYTLLGDANLDGVVDGVDFGIVAANFNKGVTGWDEGDFDYSGVVDGNDFGDVATNFNKGASAADVASATNTAASKSTATAVSKVLTQPSKPKVKQQHSR